MTSQQYRQLTQEDVDHFMEHGWIKLSGCFGQELVDKMTANLWTRLGMSPEDKTTWTAERVNMPAHNQYLASEIAPKAWAAICDLTGGEERMAETNRTWNDGLIVNLGTTEGHMKDIHGSDLKGWHVDGDFFVHYLDSPEQGLLVIPLFTDIVAGGGGTMICPAAIPHVAKHLHDHPEGVSPRMTPRAQNPTFGPEPGQGLKWFNELAKSMPRDSFVETTGKVGDVYLLHPLMLHSTSNNKLRNLRIITNPPVSLKEPFRFSREDESQYSVVERKTMAALGKDKIDYKIQGTRDHVVPERVAIQKIMMENELKRLEGMKLPASVSVMEIPLNV
ncbi:hypothetical protein BAUCODRAFT_30792 [Baudoinia panamericana UAMH 10762]|uniref:Uncharacterized protein n=1 Tax=Baudoinia panamericana (strain UAMH 10762) TaxID=717646 RepID=M2N854_BAUPA|nr:uncharacterized protein BAUCODRAFT_30792 [Baudoinia panamericana UAMH 10762]EMD00309.1 hypothetical protein BAUCODRAFT_30792 [Baudoinia panamericana UAMH 10762]